MLNLQGLNIFQKKYNPNILNEYKKYLYKLENIQDKSIQIEVAPKKAFKMVYRNSFALSYDMTTNQYFSIRTHINGKRNIDKLLEEPHILFPFFFLLNGTNTLNTYYKDNNTNLLKLTKIFLKNKMPNKDLSFLNDVFKEKSFETQLEYYKLIRKIVKKIETLDGTKQLNFIVNNIRVVSDHYKCLQAISRNFLCNFIVTDENLPTEFMEDIQYKYLEETSDELKKEIPDLLFLNKKYFLEKHWLHNDLDKSKYLDLIYEERFSLDHIIEHSKKGKILVSLDDLKKVARISPLKYLILKLPTNEILKNKRLLSKIAKDEKFLPEFLEKHKEFSEDFYLKVIDYIPESSMLYLIKNKYFTVLENMTQEYSVKSELLFSIKDLEMFQLLFTKFYKEEDQEIVSLINHLIAYDCKDKIEILRNLKNFNKYKKLKDEDGHSPVFINDKFKKNYF